MKYLFLIIAFFLIFNPAYAVRLGPGYLHSPKLIKTINSKSIAFSNAASDVCCKPDTGFSLNKGNFLLVLAGCGIGVFGLSKYRGKDFSE